MSLTSPVFRDPDDMPPDVADGVAPLGRFADYLAHPSVQITTFTDHAHGRVTFCVRDAAGRPLSHYTAPNLMF